MLIRDPPKANTRKELKVSLPARYHLDLRSMQRGSGREATDIVAEALRLYFARLAKNASADGA